MVSVSSVQGRDGVNYLLLWLLDVPESRMRPSGSMVPRIGPNLESVDRSFGRRVTSFGVSRGTSSHWVDRCSRRTNYDTFPLLRSSDTRNDPRNRIENLTRMKKVPEVYPKQSTVWSSTWSRSPKTLGSVTPVSCIT